tara:strand:- start:171 stop:443 length:273 start_codon:yes stop_codon:yes gene_type:complete
MLNRIQAKRSECGAERRQPFSIFVQDMDIGHGARSSFGVSPKSEPQDACSQDQQRSCYRELSGHIVRKRKGRKELLPCGQIWNSVVVGWT